MRSIPNSELEIMLIIRELGKPVTRVEIEEYIGSRRKERESE